MKKTEMESKVVTLADAIKAIHSFNKEELVEFLTENCKIYNDYVQNGKFNEAAPVNECMVEAINCYTGIVSKECYDELSQADDPMMAAVTKYTFETLRISDKKVGDAKIPVRSVEYVEKFIDVYKLHKMVSGGIGVDNTWWNIAEKLNLLMTADVAQGIGVDPCDINDSFAMNTISKEIDMGKTPTSKTNMLKNLTRVVQAMVGEDYKPTSHDVRYIRETFSVRDNKATDKPTVKCPSQKAFRQLIFDICHKIVTKKEYGLVSKAVKNNK